MQKLGAVNWNIEKFVSKGDYLYAVVKEHPNATKYGYVLAHRIIMETHLGRLLDTNEIVHHKNHNKKDNRIENLEVMTEKEHARMHANEQGRRMAILICPWCKNEFSREYNKTFKQKNAEYTCCSPSCRGSFSRFIQLNGRTVNVEMAISGNIVSEYIKYPHDNSEQTH